MKSIKILLMGIVAITLIASSCSKDNKSRKEILVSKNWKVSGYKLNGTAAPLEECEKDDYVDFNDDGTYTQYYGTLLCDPSEQTETGAWSLSSDEKTITIDGQDGTIKEFSESKIVAEVESFFVV